MQTTRETHVCEMALEFAFGVPYQALVQEAKTSDVCDERDLLALGHRLFLDLARLAKGQISSIHIPARLPRRGEFAIAG